MRSAGARREATGAQALRMVSFAAASAASLLLMLFPFLLRHMREAVLHAALPVLSLGIAGAFIHGVGYLPANRWLRIMFGPACAWTLMIGGAAMLFIR